MRPASEVERRRLNETFALCAIPSPCGAERACAEAVARELGAMGVDVEEDGAAPVAGMECGNLLARIPGRAHDPALRPPRHGAGGQSDRARDRRRRVGLD